MREVLNLNFGWRFSPDFRQDYVRTDYKDNLFKLVDIPHSVCEIPRSGLSEKSIARVSCYRKNFILPESMRGKTLLLTFEGVMGSAAVFVNGKPISMHRGGFTPFTCDITSEVSPYINAGDNLIAVVVDSTEREDTAPYGDMSEPAYGGGIYREVRLEAVEDVYIVNARVNPVRGEREGWLLDIAGEVSTKEDVEVKMYLCDGDNRLFGKYVLAKNGAFSYRVPVTSAVEEWSPEHPRLYDLLVTAKEKDEYKLRFGFRDVSFKLDGFYLNGVKTKLVGLERIQNFPRVGAAMPEVAQRYDVRLLRELGCNIVRTGCTPPSPKFLDACDEYGVMVFEEIPARGFVSDNADWRECLLQNTRELIMRDRHHPSVVLWGTRYEDAPDCDELFRQTYRLAMELDGQRQTAGLHTVSGPKLSAVTEAFIEDVYAVVDYTHDGTNAGLERKKNLLKTRLPYLVAGHTGMNKPAAAAEGEAVLLEQALWHARALDAAYGEPESCGVIGKSFCDYISRSALGSADGVCACGVVDSMRVKKPAAYVYESQSDDHMVMEICSPINVTEMRNGSFGGLYCFTNCDRVELYRGDKFVGAFMPDRKHFPNMPHPPVVIDDFIGELLVSEEHIEPKEAAALKNQLAAMVSDGNVPSEARLRTAAASLKNRYTPAQLCALYNKYYACHFGGAVLRFDGITNGKVLRSIVSEPATEAGIRISCERTELRSGETFDCSRIELMAVDQNGRRLYGCNDAVFAECEGSVEIIGPRLFALEAGACAFYIRAKSGKGSAAVKLSIESLGAHRVEFNVLRDRGRELW